jgi:hypothetical protein
MHESPFRREQAQATREPGAAVPGLLPGKHYWAARARAQLLLGIDFAPERKLEVDLWWNQWTGAPEIRLCLGLYPSSVEFGELSGNGFNHPQFHQRGFGTLLVNTAIQALQRIVAPETSIEGVLSNTEEQQLAPEQRSRLAACRRAFWSRFGVGFYVPPATDALHLCGSVGALRTLRSGQVAEQFPRYVPLTAFSRMRPGCTPLRVVRVAPTSLQSGTARS